MRFQNGCKWQLNFGSCNFGLKSYLWFQIELALRARSILKSRVCFLTNCTPLSSITIINYFLSSRAWAACGVRAWLHEPASRLARFAEISARLLNATKINFAITLKIFSPVSRDPGIAMSGSRLTGLKILHVIAFTGPARLNGPALNFSSKHNIRPRNQ